MKTNDDTKGGFRIEWDLRELGPRAPADAVYRDVRPQPDLSRRDYARAVSGGYVPANQQQLDKDEAA